MAKIPKLFLYSLGLPDAHYATLARLAGKLPKEIKLAAIENAADVIPDSAGWVKATRDAFGYHGFDVETIDLRHCQGQALREKLVHKDVIWVGGGNTFYLRWIMKESGADEIIPALVRLGKVYAGWSAGAIVAGPTLRAFDAMDDPAGAPTVLWGGLSMTQAVVVPHIDNDDFAASATKANQQLLAEGYNAIALDDMQVLVIQGEDQQIF
jgi:dipeptidase E